MTIFIVADEHYQHSNIIKYCNRPFSSVEEMNETLIKNHNTVVKGGDNVYHLGDFTIVKPHRNNIQKVVELIKRLNGRHHFIKGSHDYWFKFKVEIYKHCNDIIIYDDRVVEINYERHHIILCHYAMTTWPRSHYNSYQLHGHSHGKLKTGGKQYDVGVDNNGFFPVHIDTIMAIMESKGDNFNYINKNRR